MKRNTKIILTFFLALALMIPTSVGIFAADSDSSSTYVQPRWASISMITLDMAFVDGTGTASGITQKQSTARTIEGTVSVYKLVNNEWVFIDSSYGKKSVGTLGVSVNFPCEIGVTYKATFAVTAYTGTNPESETVEYTETCS